MDRGHVFGLIKNSRFWGLAQSVEDLAPNEEKWAVNPARVVMGRVWFLRTRSWPPRWDSASWQRVACRFIAVARRTASVVLAQPCKICPIALSKQQPDYHLATDRDRARVVPGLRATLTCPMSPVAWLDRSIAASVHLAAGYRVRKKKPPTAGDLLRS